MPIFIIDKTFIDQVNFGNPEAGRLLGDLRPVSGRAIGPTNRILITAELYAQLNQAERRLVDDLGIEHPNADYLNWYRTRADGVLRHVQQMDPAAFDLVTPELEATVALGEYSRAMLMSFNRELVEAYSRVAGTGRGAQRLIAPQMANILPVAGPADYNSGRRNVGLRPLNITPDGTVHPPPPPPRPPAGGGGGGRGPGGGGGRGGGDGGTQQGERTQQGDGTTAYTGDPIEPVQEYGPSAHGEGTIASVNVAFMSMNFALQRINDKIQEQRRKDKLDKLEPVIKQTLADDPQLGCLVLLYYSKGPENPDSQIDAVTIFEDARTAYGLTQDEAERNFASQNQMTTGRGDVGDRIWIKPKAPLDISRFKFPFGTTAAGLATFVPGKEKLVRVKFAGVNGFDDKMWSKDSLDVPADMTPRFYYLWPPSEISWVDGGVRRTADVDWEFSEDADDTGADIDHKAGTAGKGIPVVKLDSSINPYNATAAMIWPADNRTANLFLTSDRTEDNLGLLHGQGMEMLRWVRPEFIRIIKAPVD